MFILLFINSFTFKDTFSKSPVTHDNNNICVQVLPDERFTSYTECSEYFWTILLIFKLLVSYWCILY